MNPKSSETGKRLSARSGGFSEAGISTENLEAWVEVLVEVGGYQEIWRGESPAAFKPLWGVPVENPVLECLLESPGSATGYIRLFQFDDMAQEVIRHNTHTWDSGGIFDLDIRVPSLLPFVKPLESRGWKGVSRPVDWQFGQVHVREWLARGPDSVIVALIERLAPSLVGRDSPKKFSSVFNSSQTVADMDRAVGFYEKLGFIEMIRHTGPLLGKGGEVLGLSPNEAPSTPVDLVILQPEGTMKGSVELVKIEGLAGRDVAARGVPYNLGLNLLRFPSGDLRSYVTQLAQLGLSPVNNRIISVRLEPFGETEIAAFQSPDGAWLEFYQAFS
jgi:hypothetical protein